LSQYRRRSMFRRLLVAISMTAMPAVGSAGTITATLAPVDTSDASGLSDPAVDPIEWASAGYLVYDLVITVAGGDEWLCGSGYADLTGATFWEHPNGGDTQPEPASLDFSQLVKYDSFWNSTEEFPNVDLSPTKDTTILLPGSPLKKTSTERDCEWSTDPEEPSTYDGTYTIARYCFLPTGPWELCISGDLYLASTGGSPHPYALCVPEPATAALLVLAALALRPRR
jgi:hypothetical protein